MKNGRTAEDVLAEIHANLDGIEWDDDTTSAIAALVHEFYADVRDPDCAGQYCNEHGKALRDGQCYYCPRQVLLLTDKRT
jgi:hypothetical protein